MTHKTSTTVQVWPLLVVLTAATAARGQDDVEPAATPPGPPPAYIPAAPPHGPPPFAQQPPGRPSMRSEVRFEPNDSSVQLLMRTGEMPFEEIAVIHHGWWRPHGYYYGYGVAPIYTPLCEGACTLQLMPGHYNWGLSKEGGYVVPAAGGGIIGGPATIHAQYIDRSGYRTAGGIVGVAGLVGGIVMIAESVHDHLVCDDFGCYRHSDVNDPLLVGGIGVLIGSAIVPS